MDNTPSVLNVSCDWVALKKLIIFLNPEKACFSDAVEAGINSISETKLEGSLIYYEYCLFQIWY